jgi:Glyoxalase superfamily protein/Clp amino terminal domain, pathogenicity island component
MRDFRDAKAMARTLRAALATKGHEITISESLELIAQAFGAADWNTLAAAIRTEAPVPHENASPPPPPTVESLGPARFSAPSTAGGETPVFSAELESTLHRALASAGQRKHEYTTLEHLLLALIDDADASAMMKAFMVDPGTLKESLVSYIDGELRKLVACDRNETRPTAGFQRVVRRAVIQAQGLGRQTVTGAELLANIFAERESHAAYFLQEEGMTRFDAVNFIVHRITKGDGGSAV